MNCNLQFAASAVLQQISKIYSNQSNLFFLMTYDDTSSTDSTHYPRRRWIQFFNVEFVPRQGKLDFVLLIFQIDKRRHCYFHQLPPLLHLSMLCHSSFKKKNKCQHQAILLLVPLSHFFVFVS